MMLIESDEAIAEINGLLDACVAGRGGVAVITGPVASGKSALMRVAAERAVEAGAWFLGASCSYAQQDVQLGVVNQLLRSLPSLESPPWSVAEQADDRGRLPYPAAQPPGGSRSGSARPACARADEQLNRVVLDVTARRPLVLGVDDVHHADTQSLRCLVRLASRARSLPLLILAAGSTRDQPGCAPLQADLLAEPECRNIRLRLLSLAGIGEMLAQQLGDQATPDLTADFHALTGGSPGLIRALIEDLGHAKAGTPQPVIGPAFRQALMSCLSRTNRHMLPLARGIALLGELAEPALMSTLTSLD